MPPSPGPADTSVPCVLALDTSTERIAIALQGPGGPQLFNAPGGAVASSALLPAVHRLLADAGVAWMDVQAIAFGQGPGAFTGLRTACAVAQGLGLGLGKPLLAIDSLLIVADDAWHQTDRLAAEGDVFDVGVVMDARMDEAYAARYRRRQGRWQSVQPPALFTLPALLDEWLALPPLQALAGSGLAAFGDRLERLPAASRLPNEVDRAGALMRLALQAWADGAGIDAAQALPLYLRDKVAQTTQEREATRARKIDEGLAGRIGGLA